MFRVLFDRAIRYSVPQYQCSTFDRAVAGSITGVLIHPAVREVFSLRLSVRLGCKALRSAKSAPKRLEESGSTKRTDPGLCGATHGRCK
jgi:hypothetical protein